MYMHWKFSLPPCVQPHLIDDPPSACVDQYARGLHHVEGFRVEQVVQLRREGAGDQDKVRHLEKLLWVSCTSCESCTSCVYAQYRMQSS